MRERSSCFVTRETFSQVRGKSGLPGGVGLATALLTALTSVSSMAAPNTESLAEPTPEPPAQRLETSSKLVHEHLPKELPECLRRDAQRSPLCDPHILHEHYELGYRPRSGALRAGLALGLVFYGAPLVGSAFAGFPECSGYWAIPLAGPMRWRSCRDEQNPDASSSPFFVTLISLGQLAAVLTTSIGFGSPTRTYVRKDSARWQLEPWVSTVGAMGFTGGLTF